MNALKRLLRRQHEYDELPSRDSEYSEAPHDYLENLGGTILTPLSGSQSGFARQREWLLVDCHGNCSSVLVDKHDLVLTLGIHYRDLRIIDPHVPTPYPSGIFLRDKAIVVNLESLRCMISKDRVYVLSVPTPGKPLNCATTLSADNFFVKDLLSRLRPPRPGLTHSKSSIDRQLPFELRALESALAAAVRTLEIETMFLEKQTLPALTRLMLKVTRAELNTVRHSKTAVNKLLERIGHIKKELEDLLDDDDDMRDCYLARKEEQKRAAEEAAARASRPPAATDDDDCGGAEEDEEETRVGAEEGGDLFRMESLTGGNQLRSAFSSASYAFPSGPMMEPLQPTSSSPLSMAPADSAPPPGAIAAPTQPPPEQLPSAMSAPATEMPSLEQKRPKKRSSRWRELQHLSTLVGVLRGMGHQGANISMGEIFDPNDISGCESLLEAYFLQIDYLMSRLSSVKDKIAGIEDQLNIEMDHRRNELQALDLAITAFMSSLAFISMIGGILGMNMKNGYEESMIAFYSTVGVTLFVAFILLLGILWYARSKRLLFIPYMV